MELLIELVVAAIVAIGQGIFVNFLFKPFIWVYKLFEFPSEEEYGFKEEELVKSELATITEAHDEFGNPYLVVHAKWEKDHQPVKPEPPPTITSY